MFECDVMSCIPPISGQGALRYGTNLRYNQQGMIAHITANIMTKRWDGTALCSGRDLNACTYYSQCRLRANVKLRPPLKSRSVTRPLQLPDAPSLCVGGLFVSWMCRRFFRVVTWMPHKFGDIY
jgi:hypothetical protein